MRKIFEDMTGDLQSKGFWKKISFFWYRKDSLPQETQNTPDHLGMIRNALVLSVAFSVLWGKLHSVIKCKATHATCWSCAWLKFSRNVLMKELSCSHSPFRREQCVCVLTDRSDNLLYTGSGAGGARPESTARICFFPLLTHSHQLWDDPGKEQGCTMVWHALRNPQGHNQSWKLHSPHHNGDKPPKGAQGQMETWSQGCAEPGPGEGGLVAQLWIMKTSVTSEKLFVLTGILI